MDTPLPPPHETPPALAVRSTLVTWVLLMLAVGAPMVVMMSPYAVSLATGAVLAVLFYPLYARLRRWLPGWAAGLTITVSVLLLILVPATLLVFGAIRQAADLLTWLTRDDALTIPEAIERVRAWLPSTAAFGTPTEIRALLQQGLTSVSQAASGILLGFAQGIPDLLLQLTLIVLSTHFLLVDGRKTFAWVAGKLPLSRQIRGMLVGSFRSATTAVVLASFAAAGAQSFVVLLGFWILGVPGALLAGGSSFLLAWIPTVGTVPVWAGAAVWLYFHDSPIRCAVMVGLGLVIGVTDNIVRPLVLRGREEMHPLVSMLAILGGLAWMGIPGLFLGPLFASMALAVLEIWPAVATYCGIPVTDAGDEVPDVPMLAPAGKGRTR